MRQLLENAFNKLLINGTDRRPNNKVIITKHKQHEHEHFLQRKRDFIHQCFVHHNHH